MGSRGAKYGHDGVTEHAIDSSFIASNGPDGSFKDAIHDFGPGFRIELFAQGGRADYIAKEHRNDAAFRFSIF